MNQNLIRRALTVASFTLLLIGASAGAQAQNLKRFELRPKSLTGGATAHARASLDQAAPAGGVTLTIASDQAFAQPTASVTVAAGERSASFDIPTSTVTADSTANITVTDPSGNSLSAALAVKAPIIVAMKSLTIRGGQVVSGQSTRAFLQLNARAPSGGFTASLSFDQSFAHAPSSVTVQEGNRGIEFTITTDAGQTGSTTLTATDASNNTLTAPLSVVNLGLSGVQLHPDHVQSGGSVRGRVRLNGRAPSGGLAITLSSDQAFAHPDATVTVPAGRDSAEFSVATDVGANGTANIGATDGTNSFSAPLVVFTQTLDVTRIGAGDGPRAGGSTIHGFVLLNGFAPSAGFTVNLSSDNAALQPPASVTIPAGQFFAVFDMTSTAVTANTVVNLTATDPNNVSVTTQITLQPLGARFIGFWPDHVLGGSNAVGFVVLNGVAPDGGFTFSLASDSTSAQPPATVTVPAGARFVSFTVPTTAVTQFTKVNISATDPSGNVTTTVLKLLVSLRP